MFRAASSGDGGYLEPAFYPSLSASYDSVYGGPPTDPAALPNYLRMAPSLRGKEACGAMLLQMATPYSASIDLYSALRKATIPAQITLRSEEHTSELQSLMRNSYAVFCLKKKNSSRLSIHHT